MPTKIDWCDAVWNPVWGCLHNCPFCYARRFAGRFYRNVARKNNLSQEEAEKLRLFQPVFLPANFGRRFGKKEKIVFVNSMSDVAFWKQEWIDKVFERITTEKEKVFLFLTKAPEVYRNFPQPLPENVWLGISATDTLSLVKRAERLFGKYDVPPAEQCFVSIEPVHEDVVTPETVPFLEKFGWIIVGPETGSLNKKLKKNYSFNLPKWIEKLKDFCSDLGIPLFTKEACGKYGTGLKQEFPVEFPVGRPEGRNETGNQKAQG